MAKLTVEQKVANKATRKARDQRYSARNREYTAAKVQIEADKLALPEKAAAIEADAASDRLLQEREARRRELLERIAELQKEVDALGADFAPRMDAARQARSSAYALLRAASEKLDNTLDEQFPDMVGVYGPAQWREELIAESR